MSDFQFLRKPAGNKIDKDALLEWLLDHNGDISFQLAGAEEFGLKHAAVYFSAYKDAIVYVINSLQDKTMPFNQDSQ